MNICSEMINYPSFIISRNYTICLLADIHNTNFSKKTNWEELSKEIASFHPNIILIAGDIIYTADDLFDENTAKKLEFLFLKLGQIAPTYFCLGNHDLKDGNIHNVTDTIQYYQQLDDKIKLINNESIIFGDINIFGINPDYKAYYQQLKNNGFNFLIEALLKKPELINLDPSGKFNILITHSPEVLIGIDKYIDYLLTEKKQETLFQLSQLKKVKNFLQSMDLFLCGHMHDGLIPKHWQKLGIVKNGNGIKACEGFDNKGASLRKVENCRGTYKCFNGTLIINGGITKWCHPNLLFSLIDRHWAKDITILKLDNLSNQVQQLYKYSLNNS